MNFTSDRHAGLSEFGELFQLLDSRLDLSPRRSRRLRQPESFAAKRRHDTPVNHRAANVVVNVPLGRSQVAHHGPDKGIARSGRVDQLVEGICRADKKASRARENRTVRTLLYHDVFRPKPMNL